MAVFKEIGGGNHIVEPFEVNYSQSFTWTSGSTSNLSGSGFSINLANEPPTNYPIGTTQSLGGVTDGGFNSYPMFNSIKKYFYVDEDGTSFTLEYGDLDLNANDGSARYSFNTVGGPDVSAGTVTNVGFKTAQSMMIHKLDRYAEDRSTLLNTVAVGNIVTYEISERRWYKYKITTVETAPTGYANRYRFGIELIDSDTSDGTANVSTDAWNAGSPGPIVKFTFTGPGGNVYDFYPSGSMFVWNIPSNYTGDGIKPDTFKIELDGNTINIQDDGNGKLRLNRTGSVVGNVFYNHGIAAVQRNITASVSSLISKDGISIHSSSGALPAGVTSSFQSMIDIYEHTINCRIEPSELNVTLNPTSYHIGPSGSEYAGSSSYSNHVISGSALPYVTTIGLYNNSNELLAVGKLSKPIVRTRYTDQTFVVKFDE